MARAQVALPSSFILLHLFANTGEKLFSRHVSIVRHCRRPRNRSTLISPTVFKPVTDEFDSRFSNSMQTELVVEQGRLRLNLLVYGPRV
jgi:hypothetical protein